MPRHFKQVKIKWELRNFANSYFWKFFKALRYDFSYGDLKLGKV